jgi:putative endonuclease
MRCRGGEIDLIYKDRRTLVFVEVRGRSARGWVSGLESVTASKRQRIERTAREFLVKADREFLWGVEEIRFDVVESDGERLSHIPDAWTPTGAIWR